MREERGRNRCLSNVASHLTISSNCFFGLCLPLCLKLGNNVEGEGTARLWKEKKARKERNSDVKKEKEGEVWHCVFKKYNKVTCNLTGTSCSETQKFLVAFQENHLTSYVVFILFDVKCTSYLSGTCCEALGHPPSPRKPNDLIL